MKTTVEVEVLKTHQYAGRGREKGTRYSVEAGDLHILTVAGLVKRVEEKPRQGYQRKDLRAEE